MICHIIYPLGTLIHILLSIQTSKSSQKDNIQGTKTKVKTYCEIMWSLRLGNFQHISYKDKIALKQL